MPQFISTSIEISLPPSEVRRLFLDFDKIPEWHQGFTISRLPPTSVDTTLPNEIPIGERIKIVSDGFTLHPVVQENTPSSLIWQGSFHGLLIGRHIWRFEAVGENGEKTRFFQEERFGGILALLYAEWWPKWLGGMRDDLKVKFEGFNGDFKRWCENYDGK